MDVPKFPGFSHGWPPMTFEPQVGGRWPALPQRRHVAVARRLGGRRCLGKVQVLRGILGDGGMFSHEN